MKIDENTFVQRLDYIVYTFRSQSDTIHSAESHHKHTPRPSRAMLAFMRYGVLMGESSA